MKYLVSIVSVFLTAILALCTFGLRYLKSVQIGSGQSKFYDEQLFMEFRKTPCFGSCPEYLASISKDGLVKYKMGPYQYSGKEGEFNLTPSELGQIKQTVQDANFYSFEDVYDDPGLADLPSTIITVYTNGGSKQVTGRIGAPKKFAELADLIHQILVRHEPKLEPKQPAYKN